MTTLLVANRGEIALRIFRTAERMGMRTVAVYSDADADAPHVRAADQAVHIGPAPAADSYLRRDRIIEAALEARADLIHPGYGFLAEDDTFARDCEQAGLRFVGPPSDVLRRVGDKASSKSLAIEAGVPVLPAYSGEDQSDDTFARAAQDIGFPLIVKPSGGGGGKGMAVVHDANELAGAVASARRIARAAFGDDRLILERYLDGPRHVEVQVLADAHGAVIHLGERDCSLQRRHQKILECAPAPNLDGGIRTKLHDAAVAFARHAGYVGAGTCEFLVGLSGEAGFIEMNARLQVEHPVTEIVTGLDLVELQLRVAMGEALPVVQEDVRFDGHSVEVRIYAEAPEEGFLPQTGRVLHVGWPSDARVDAGVEEGTEITTHYDPMLAKVVVRGEDRAGAMRELQRALGKTRILGLRTNIPFLANIVRHPDVESGTISTDWLDRSYRPPPSSEADDEEAAVVAAAEADRILSAAGTDPWSALGAWRPGGGARTLIVVRTGEDERVVNVEGRGPFVVNGRHVGRGSGCHDWWIDTPDGEAWAARGDDRWFVWVSDAPREVLVGAAPRRLAGAGPSRLDSPLPGQVIAVRVASGQEVSEGDELVVVEAMKMEHAIRAPAAGQVRAVLCAEGDQVDRGQPLVDFEPS